MNKTRTACTALLLAAASAAQAYTYTDEHGWRYQCRDEKVDVVSQTDDHRTAGVLIGGALGGLAGNQIGEGKGNTAATAAGAVAGAMIGRNAAKPKTRHHVVTEKRCHRIS